MIPGSNKNLLITYQPSWEYLLACFSFPHYLFLFIFDYLFKSSMSLVSGCSDLSFSHLFLIFTIEKGTYP